MQRALFREIRQHSCPNPGPLHTPRARVRGSPGFEELQSQLPQQATSHNAQVRCTAPMQQLLAYVIFLHSGCDGFLFVPMYDLVRRFSPVYAESELAHLCRGKVVGSD